MLDDRGTNARAAARHEHAAAPEAGIGREIRHGPSQIGKTEDHFAREHRAGRESRKADLPVGVAHRLDAEMPLARWDVYHDMAKGLGGLEIEPQTALRPQDHR